MKGTVLTLLVALGLTLTACSSRAAAQPSATHVFATQPLPSPAAMSQPSDDLTRVDGQGMVMVEVTPVNIQSAAETLDFDVAMNTHSVDLGMNLASLSILRTDTGVTVQATSWSAPGGGHHVRGTLRFPATQGGKPILAGASKLTLTITNVDAPARTFEWPLQ